MIGAAALLAAATAHAAAGAMDVTVGGGTVVPAHQSGSVAYASLGLASFIADGHALGLRVAIAPSGVGGDGADRATTAWAPGIDYRAYLAPSARLTPFFTAGLGFVLADRAPQGRDNLASLAGQVGVGLEAGLSLRSGSRLIVAPALGFAPGAFFGGGPFSLAAPIADLRIGVRSGPPSE